MGLDYSIRTYIKKEKFSASLKWLFENTSNNGDAPLQIRCNNETSFLHGGNFRIEQLPNKTGNTIEDFTVLSFYTSLIFDIDPKVISPIRSQIQNNLQCL